MKIFLLDKFTLENPGVIHMFIWRGSNISLDLIEVFGWGIAIIQKQLNAQKLMPYCAII